MGDKYGSKERSLENLAGHRKLRENADERWERSIGAALACGNSLRKVAEVAGVSHTQVARVAARWKIPLAEDGAEG